MFSSPVKERNNADAGAQEHENDGPVDEQDEHLEDEGYHDAAGI